MAASPLAIGGTDVTKGPDTGSLKGKVETADHFSLNNIRITVYSENAGALIPISSSFTDANGSFVVHELPLNKNYTIHVLPPQPTKSTTPLVERKGVLLTYVNPNQEIVMTVSRLSHFIVQLLKGKQKLVGGEVYIDGKPYGKGSLGQLLIGSVGAHRISAKTDECSRPEERIETLLAWSENTPHTFELLCQD
jgi:hypothetical protein